MEENTKPFIEKIGTNHKGEPEYQVLVCKRGSYKRIDMGLGVSKEEAERIKADYIKEQIKKSISGRKP